MTPKPYFPRNAESQISQAGIAGVTLLDSNMASTKSWYETASLTKRRPAEFTAITPGFARSSTRCGNKPLEPSLRGTIETGDQSPLVLCSGDSVAPSLWPISTPSPLLSDELIEYVGTGRGMNVSRKPLLCAYPPVASTTPLRAFTRIFLPPIFSCAPLTPCRSPSTSMIDASNRIGTLRLHKL